MYHRYRYKIPVENVSRYKIKILFTYLRYVSRYLYLRYSPALIILLPLSLKFQKKYPLKSPKLPSSTTPLSFDAPGQRNPREYPHTTHLSHWPTFLALIGKLISSFKFLQ